MKHISLIADKKIKGHPSIAFRFQIEQKLTMGMKKVSHRVYLSP